MSNLVPFMSPRLVGERFNGHAIPLEVLKDLAVLEEMVIEVAKWQFFQENPGRQRTPRGFTDGISLTITEIGDGSAVPHIMLCIAAGAAMLLPQIPPHVEQARDRIFGAIDAAGHDEPINKYLPDSLLSFFDSLGRNLRDGEWIEFRPENRARPARLDKNTRRKLILASSQIRELTDDVILRGTIPEADQDKMTFELQVIGGTKVSAPIADQHRETILSAFAGYEKGTRVVLKGLGKFNRLERLQTIGAVDHISILEPNDVPARLDEFRMLKDGWLDGKGKAPTTEGLDWFSAQFENQYPDGLPLPYVYPTAEGGIQVEWSIAGHEVSLEVSFSSRQGEWHGLDLRHETDIGRILQLDQTEDWNWITGEIQRLAGVTA